MKTRGISFLVAACLLSTVAWAQPAEPGAQAAPAHPHAGERRAHDPAARQVYRSQRLEALKAELKLTPAQEAVWTAYAMAMEPTSRPEKKHFDRAELEKLSVPERQEKMQALRKERQQRMNAEMEKRHAATKALYAALTPEQKKVFDTHQPKPRGARGKAEQ